MLNTESLVSRAIEFAVGRKIELADCRHLGKYSQDQVKSQTLLVKLWDWQLLLNTKYRLRGFTDEQMFLHEDIPPEDQKVFMKIKSESEQCQV